jgi:GntR family transcriptional repressor for pyruvate dehydrogenase complex
MQNSPIEPVSPSPAAVHAPTAKTRVFEDICDEIRGRLSRGELKPGDKLPSERDLAETFGSSRAAVREALRNLERGGVIEQRKGLKGGTYITRVDPTIVTRSLNDLLSFGGISIESLTESRSILLDAVIRLACERGTQADFDLLQANIERTEAMAANDQPAERRIQLLEFYRLLGCATHNEVMVILVAALTDMVFKLLERHNVAPRSSTLKTYRQILRALRQREKEKAAELMRVHLDRLHAHFAKAVKRQDAATPGH